MKLSVKCYFKVTSSLATATPVKYKRDIKSVTSVPVTLSKIAGRRKLLNLAPPVFSFGPQFGYCISRALFSYFSERHIEYTQIAKFMGPTWGPTGSSRPQIDPMLAPWTWLSEYISIPESAIQRRSNGLSNLKPQRFMVLTLVTTWIRKTTAWAYFTKGIPI